MSFNVNERVERGLVGMYRKMGLDPAGKPRASALLSQAFEQKKLKPSQFSIRALAMECFGEDWASRFGGMSMIQAVEAGDAIDSTTFADISGQLFFNAILEGYRSPGFLWPNLVREVQTNLDGEKIPGIASFDEGDATKDKIGEGMPYPRVGTSADYVETPSTEKRGLIVALTKEAVFFDRTKILLERSTEAGQRILGTRKEKRILDVVLGLITNTFKWRGTVYATYTGDSAGWAAVGKGVGGNLLGSNELVDWSDFDAVLQDRQNIRDPETGDPIELVGAMQVLVMPAKAMTCRRILSATEIDYGVTGSATSAVTITKGPNPLQGMFELLPTSQLAVRRLIDIGSIAEADAAKYWYLGDFKRAFWYMANWGIEPMSAPSNSQMAFEQDIFYQFRVSERGVPAVIAPWFVTKCTG